MLKGMCKKINQVAKKRWCFDLLVLIAVVISIFLWDMNGQLKIANLSSLEALRTFFVGIGITVIFECIFFVNRLLINNKKDIFIFLWTPMLFILMALFFDEVVCYVGSITPEPELNNHIRNGILITLAGVGGYCASCVIKLFRLVCWCCYHRKLP